jgi:hypothetical protein
MPKHDRDPPRNCRRRHIRKACLPMDEYRHRLERTKFKIEQLCLRYLSAAYESCPNSSRICFGRFSREGAHSRVPAPPHTSLCARYAARVSSVVPDSSLSGLWQTLRDHPLESEQILPSAAVKPGIRLRRGTRRVPFVSDCEPASWLLGGWITEGVRDAVARAPHDGW